MSDHSTHQARFSFFRRPFGRKNSPLIPIAVTGAGGAAVIIWFEEFMLYTQELLSLIFLPILAGVIYLLDILIFKSRMPKREDLTNTNDRGAKK
jgi:hypothetical protein